MAAYYKLSENGQLQNVPYDEFMDWYVTINPTLRLTHIDDHVIETTFLGIDVLDNPKRPYCFQTIRENEDGILHALSTSVEDALSEHETMLKDLAIPRIPYQRKIPEDE